MAVLAGGLLVAGALILNEARHLYFFGDDWAFLLRRDLAGDGLLEPHNEHWSTLPLLVYRTMFHVFGIDHHLVWATMPVALHLATCALLFALLRRHGIGPWVSVLTTFLLAFLCGSLGENPLWSFQIGFLGSSALGLAALLLADRAGASRRGLAAVWVLTVLSLMCSGMAVPMAVWLGLLVLLTRGLTAAVVAVAPPAAVYVLWYVGYGRHAASPAPDPTVDLLLDFVWAGLASLWEEITRVPSAGGVILLALAVVVLVGRGHARARPLALSGLVAAATTYLIVGISRSGFGVESATSSRYAYFGVLMTLPAFAVAASWLAGRLAERPVERRVVWIVAVALLATSGWAQLHSFRLTREAQDQGLRERVLAAVQLVREGAPLVAARVDGAYNRDIDVDTLAQPEVLDALPDLPVTRQGRLDAAVNLQAAAVAESTGLPAPDRLRRHGLTTRGPLDEDCTLWSAEPGAFLELPPSRTGSEVALAPEEPVLRMQMIGRHGASYVRQLTVPPRTRTYVASSSPDASLRVYADSPEIVICSDALSAAPAPRR